MSILQLLLFAVGLMTAMGLGYRAFAGPSAAKEGARRLQGVRFRHSESTIDKVESQLKKAIAARKPKMHMIAGSGSRIEALALRLHAQRQELDHHRSISTLSLGLALAVTVLHLPRSRARRCCRWASACWWARACRTWC